MTNHYLYDKTILGSQSFINGKRADYSEDLRGGQEWSYTGTTFKHVVRSDVLIKDGDNSSRFEGGYNRDDFNPNLRAGGSTEQSIQIDEEVHAASYDYSFELYDENFNRYEVAVIDIDLDDSNDFRWNANPGQEILESGHYLIFIGDVPPPDKILKILGYRSPKTSHFEMGAQRVCFTAGTLIETEEGEMRVEELTVGKMIRTMDAGLQPLRWIGADHITSKTMRENHRPIRVQTNALGQNFPNRDLTVSPQHRIMVASKVARNMFDNDEILIAAKHLLDLPGVDIVDDAQPVSYWHFLLDRHQIVFSNGTPTESLYPGPQALKAFQPSTRQEILASLPCLWTEDINDYYPPARPFISGRQARQFVSRSLKNNRDLIRVELVAGL